MNKTTTQPGVTGPSKLIRPRFGPGMLLQHEDLEQLTDYTRHLNRLMFQSLFGCGVICGLVVTTKKWCGKVKVTVEPGVAFSCSGNPIYVPEEKAFDLADVGAAKGKHFVVLCRTENSCSPRTAICSSDSDEAPAVCTRVRDGFEIKVLSEPPVCACGCYRPADQPTPDKRDPKSAQTRAVDDVAIGKDDRKCHCQCVDPESECYKDHYDGKCGCSCDDCCNCDCVILALIELKEGGQELDEKGKKADHRVRRFIRPVLMADPEVNNDEPEPRGEDSDVALAATTPSEPEDAKQRQAPKRIRRGKAKE